MRVAVVGHCEWVDFLRVEHIPDRGEIVHAEQAWAEVGGGGAISAVQLGRLAGGVTLFTAVGDDDLGARVCRDLEDLGVRVAATTRRGATRRAVALIDATGERAITVIGPRLDPRAGDALPWAELDRTDAVFVTAGDAQAMQLARRARVMVATSRALPVLRRSGVRLDALVGSAADPAEAYGDDLSPPPRLVVRTDGARGGTFAAAGHAPTRYSAAPLEAPAVDHFGAGDSFAAALTFALADGMGDAAAVGFAARCAAAVVQRRGPYDGQPRLSDLGG